MGYILERNGNGHACYIMKDGKVVLHLVPGTSINEANAEDLVCVLNNGEGVHESHGNCELRIQLEALISERMGMQAENETRAAGDSSPAYGMEHFQENARMMRDLLADSPNFLDEYGHVTMIRHKDKWEVYAWNDGDEDAYMTEGKATPIGSGLTLREAREDFRQKSERI